MATFEEAIEEIELALEKAREAEAAAQSYRAKLIFLELDSVQVAIDDWRQG